MSGGPVESSHELYEAFERAVRVALEEDLGGDDLSADVTTSAVVPEGLLGQATLYAKQRGVICGLDALRATYAQLDERVAVTPNTKDGDDVDLSDALATIGGPVNAILVGERVALNLVGHLSGVATHVRAFARNAPDVTLTDTRKTLPGLRLLQKYAVRVGGGSNHRFALWDGILIKDNHIVAAGSVGEAVRRARELSALPVQAECTTHEEVDEALEAGAHALLLDNRGADELRELVTYIRSKKDYVLIEASGGINESNVAEIAATGVDRISVGAFTHSAPALDVSLTLEETWEA